MYFADATAQKLWKLGLSGGDPAALASGVLLRDLRFYAGALYYSDANAKQVARISSAVGSSPELLTAGGNRAPAAVETDGKTLFWVDDLQINATPIGQPSSRKALGVAGPSESSGLGHIARLRLSGTRLYWADDAGNLGWTASDGQSCGLLVKGAGGITGWDIDDTAAYALVHRGTSTELLAHRAVAGCARRARRGESSRSDERRAQLPLRGGGPRAAGGGPRALPSTG